MKSLVCGFKQDYDPHRAIAVWETGWVRFGFDCFLDVMEEEALNRNDCIEVLRNLISSSKRDIEKLEAKLFVLQTQIEWANSNKEGDVIELCSKFLKEKIDSLKLATCNLKNNNDQSNANAIVLQQHKDADLPNEIHETITTVLKNALYEEQDSHKNIMEDGLSALETSVVLFNKNVTEDGLEAPGTSVVLFNKNVTEDGLDAPVTSIRLSSQNVLQKDALETSLRQYDNNVIEDAPDDPETSVQHSNDNVVKAAMDATQTSGTSHKQDFDMIGPKENLSESQHVDTDESGVSASGEVRISATPKSPLIFEATKVKIESEELTNSAVDDWSLKSYLMSQPQRVKKAAKGKAKSATYNIAPSELSLTIQRQRQVMIKSENVCLPDHPNNGDLRSAFMMQGKKDKREARAMQVMVQKPRTSTPGKGISPKTSLKVQGAKGANGGWRSLLASTEMSQNSEPKVAEMEKATVKLELVSLPIDETHAGAGVIRSNKGNAKRPNQMDPPNSSFDASNCQASATPITYKRTYKRTKKSVLSNSSGEKESGKFPSNGISRESSMSLVPFDAMKSRGSLIPNTAMPQEIIGPDQLRTWTVPQLKSLIKSRGLTGYSKFKKEQLVQLLTQVEVRDWRLI